MKNELRGVDMYHWTNIKGVLGNGDGRQVVEGETLSAEGGLEMCRCGMHASPTVAEALAYAPGCRLWRVELSGERIDDNNFARKSVARSRTALVDYGDQTEGLMLYARWCAERARQHADDANAAWVDAAWAAARAAAQADAAWAARAAAGAAARAAAGAAARAAARAAAAWDAEREEQIAWWEDYLDGRYGSNKEGGGK